MCEYGNQEHMRKVNNTTYDGSDSTKPHKPTYEHPGYYAWLETNNPIAYKINNNTRKRHAHVV